MFNSAKDMGIDLGTANTLIYIKDKGVVLNEATVIAYDKRTARIIATGTKAKAMLGKAPKEIVVIRPLEDGVISDFDMTTEMLERFIRQALGEKRPSGMRIVVGVPSGVTAVEKMAVEEVLTDLSQLPEFILLKNEMIDSVREAIHQLDPKNQKLCVLLMYCTQRQAARIMGIKRSAVRRRWRTIRKKLKACLQKDYL